MESLSRELVALLFNFIFIWLLVFSVPLLILLGPVLVFRWKKDEWSGFDLALLLLAPLVFGALGLGSGSLGTTSLAHLFQAQHVLSYGVAIVGWCRGVLLRVLPKKWFSLYWAILLSVLGILCLLAAPRGNC